MDNQSDYYVYVYIDPRNFEEFYYGKGKGLRKDSHLYEDSDSEKSKRIKAIKKASLLPIIKVIAKDLTESQALLIEKTLLWKLGKQLTNVSTGHFANKFRPHDTMHLSLSGFDYQNGIYYYNVGEGEVRNWDDYVRYGFISAGQHPKYNEPMKTFEVGDIVVAYLKGHGYVGIGTVTQKAIPIREIRIDDNPIYDIELSANMLNQAENDAYSEWVCLVNWHVTKPRENAYFLRNSQPKLFTSQLIKASLDKQEFTKRFLEDSFDIKFLDLVSHE